MTEMSDRVARAIDRLVLARNTLANGPSRFEDDDDDGEDRSCWQCGGEGWGIIGLNWTCDDPINGPHDGDIETCPCCNGSGLAKDCTYW